MALDHSASLKVQADRDVHVYGGRVACQVEDYVHRLVLGRRWNIVDF